MLVFNSGQISDVQESLLWGIFVYKKDDDPTVLVGTCPLVYKTYDDLDGFLKTKSGKEDWEEWRSNGYVVVIRPFKGILLA